MADFPPVGMKEDGRYREDSMIDVAHKQTTDGGYTVSRPKTTRTPRKKFVTGFTLITQAEKLLLVSFWNSKKGSSETFTWTDPIDSVTYTVRFGGALNFSRAFPGSNHHWNVPGITLEEA